MMESNACEGQGSRSERSMRTGLDGQETEYVKTVASSGLGWSCHPKTTVNGIPEKRCDSLRVT